MTPSQLPVPSQAVFVVFKKQWESIRKLKTENLEICWFTVFFISSQAAKGLTLKMV